ncbi:lysozyme [Brachybacterium sp. JHP9]|uniref:Lysozyme n=1 Tax=Brachybacterium equifaecis TaxID=2910770 RepID=A0ABT0R2V2_9MICO|nr:GH25 family lysozyme [Brachybacterium equifaecis]MCL6424221.1 lysozyme [Brachybacterium equifaecis]
MSISPPPGAHSRPSPRPRRFTREEVRRRQIIAVAGLGLVLLLAIGSCAALLGRGDPGAKAPGVLDPTATALGDPSPAPHRADDDAMVAPDVPTDAPALAQLPAGTVLEDGEVLGIDVANHQEQIDWKAVRADGVSVAYIKATEGSGYIDPEFADNWRGAKSAGVTPGAYHYFTLCSPGADQARDFLAAAPVDDSALPPALDLEFDGACDARPEAADAQAEVDAFIAIVEEAWGRRMVMYSSSDWRSHYGLPSAEGRPAWLYSDAGRPEYEWAVWQVRFDGSVDGIQTDVDIDVVRPEVLREHARIG